MTALHIYQMRVYVKSWHDSTYVDNFTTVFCMEVGVGSVSKLISGIILVNNHKIKTWDDFLLHTSLWHMYVIEDHRCADKSQKTQISKKHDHHFIYQIKAIPLHY